MPQGCCTLIVRMRRRSGGLAPSATIMRSVLRPFDELPDMNATSG
jgi:hypothetical protein